MKNLLFQVSAADPTTFVAIGLLFVRIVLAASYISIRRAGQIDPVTGLRVG
jgi:ABC-type lipoprotein release transport system permease subunit